VLPEYSCEALLDDRRLRATLLPKRRDVLAPGAEHLKPMPLRAWRSTGSVVAFRICRGVGDRKFARYIRIMPHLIFSRPVGPSIIVGRSPRRLDELFAAGSDPEICACIRADRYTERVSGNSSTARSIRK